MEGQGYHSIMEDDERGGEVTALDGTVYQWPKSKLYTHW
jgi:hypothetical protein